MIINLTQHPATPEQRSSGVVDLPDEERKVLQAALTFDAPPTALEIVGRAAHIALIAARHLAGAEDIAREAMIGGALWLMAPLADALRDEGITPLFAFSRRVVVEETLADGSVRKVTVFKHGAFVPAL